MRLRGIRIRDFRKLSGPFCIDEIDDGITVISGDNEEGKSTVLEAIRTVLFTRHRILGDAAERMQPFGQSVRPEISLDFEIGATRYALRKTFCRRPEAELRWPGGRAIGDAAEDKLQEILRFVPAGKRASKAEHQGIWGLFWVAQGTSFEALRMSEGSRQTLTSALEGEVGQVLGGDRGRALLHAIRLRLDQMFTATGRPREEYKKSMEAVDALEGKVETLQDALRAYEDKIAHLERVRSCMRAYERDHVLERAQDELRTAEAANQRVVVLRDKLREAEGAVQIARLRRDAANERWQVRVKRMAVEARARDQADSAGASEAAARRTVQALERVVAEARAGEEENRRAYGAAEAIYGAAEQGLRRARAERELADLAERCRQAAQAFEAAQTARAEGLAILVDDAKLGHLRELEKTAAEARVRLRAVATRLDFAPMGERRVTSAAGDVPPDRPLLLTEATSLRLQGFGEITVTPGGEDLSGLRIAAASAEDQLCRALQSLGVADPAAAARAGDKRQKLLTEAEMQERLASVYAPKGLAALGREMRLKEAELAALQEGATRPTPTVEAAEAQVKAASVQRAARLETYTEQRQRVADLERQCREAREVWIKSQALHQGTAAQAERAADELRDDRGSVPDDQLAVAANDTAAALATAEALNKANAAALERQNPEAVALRLEQAASAARHAREDIEKLRKTANDLAIELRALGQQGLGEDLAAKQGELDQARKRCVAMEREAKAIKLLYDTLRQAEREAKDAFLGPVRKRVHPYLELLLPGAELELAQDTLDILHLRRGDVPEPFSCLSIGTREQLAILTRLAFADFLRERGQPAAVILDDALAYSDCGRFDRMQLVMRKAAKNLQIIVLTCRERDYIGRGLPIVRLSECRSLEPVG